VIAKMKRREFIALLGGAAAAWPPAARAQQAERMRHVAVLMSGAEGDPETQARLAGIRQGLSRFGWSEGRNVEIAYRYASASEEQAQLLAKDLVALKPEVIVAPSSTVAAALQRETRAIPIVFVGAIDPVGAGLVASLARRGGGAP
jgi:putative tryptophan/tyrosine transport system substrate-binding protein